MQLVSETANFIAYIGACQDPREDVQSNPSGDARGDLSQENRNGRTPAGAGNRSRWSFFARWLLSRPRSSVWV